MPCPWPPCLSPSHLLCKKHCGTPPGHRLGALTPCNIKSCVRSTLGLQGKLAPAAGAEDTEAPCLPLTCALHSHGPTQKPSTVTPQVLTVCCSLLPLYDNTAWLYPIPFKVTPQPSPALFAHTRRDKTKHGELTACVRSPCGPSRALHAAVVPALAGLA